MGLSCTDSEINGDCSQKSQIFPTPCIWCPSWRGSSWIGYQRWEPKKLEWWGYWTEKEVWRYL